MNLTTFALSLIDKNTKLPKTNADNNHLQRGLTLTFAVIGAVALMLLVIAGFRWVISEGDPTRIQETRRMIIYIFIGLIVLASAATIVTVALGQL